MNVREYDQNQSMMFPPHLRDFLPDDHQTATFELLGPIAGTIYRKSLQLAVGQPLGGDFPKPASNERAAPLFTDYWRPSRARAFLASFHPCLAARRYQRTASSRSLATPTPFSYLVPRKYWALA